MAEFGDGLVVLDSACEKAGVNFVPLIAETCRWVDPRTFRGLPVWYPESYRGANYPFYPKEKVREVLAFWQVEL